MKCCKKCSVKYPDDVVFCPTCGSQLEPTPSTQNRKLPIIIAVCLLVLFLLGFAWNDHNKLTAQQDAMNAARVQKEWEEYLNTPTTSDLRINSGWRHYVDGNYIYVEGTVTNKSDKDISYYEIKAEYLDIFDNVVTTDWTNGSRLGPGETQDFSIMHKTSSKIHDVKLSIQEVS